MFGGFFANTQSLARLESLYSYRMTTSSYVRMNNYSAIDFDSTITYTFGFVVKLNTAGINQSLISNVDSSGLNGLFCIIRAVGGFSFQWRNDFLNSRKQINFSGTTLTTGNWYTILFQIDPTDINNWFCYINNIIQTPSIIGASTSANIVGKPLDFGAYSDGTLFFAELDYNQAVIWDKALTSDERTAFYNSGQPDFNVANADQLLRVRFDNDTWDSGNSRFDVVNDKNATGGVTVNIAEADKILITHVIFHPVQKSLNRTLEITYTLRIQMGD